MKIIRSIIIGFLLCLSCIISSNAYAHAALPPEVMQFLEEHPNATQEEFNAFMVETYGEAVLDELYGPNPSDTGTIPLLEVCGNNELESEEQCDDGNTISGDGCSAQCTAETEENNTLTIPANIGKITTDANMIISTLNEQLTLSQTLKQFIILGIEHILGGLDHILFVISIILILLPWTKILKMITAFTIAHSLTLILAGSGALILSARIVEPIIAFSIAYMAITSVFLKHIPFFRNIHNKILVIFLFGLFHGLGFAGVLTDLQIPENYFITSLISFNIGVEIGQIIILLIVLPPLFLVKRNATLYNNLIQIIAGSISALALYWVVQRIFT